MKHLLSKEEFIMKLNKECIRDMLLYIEEHCVFEDNPIVGRRIHEVSWDEITEALELSKYSDDDKHYTIQKLFEGHYIEGDVIPPNCYHSFDVAHIRELTLRGHDLIDNMRPEPVWTKTKNILTKVGDLSLDIMSTVAGEAMAAYVKSITGQP